MASQHVSMKWSDSKPAEKSERATNGDGSKHFSADFGPLAQVARTV